MGFKRRTKEAIKSQKDWMREHPDAKMLSKAKRALQTSLEIHQIEYSVGKIPSLLSPMPEEAVLKIDKWYEERKRRNK